MNSLKFRILTLFAFLLAMCCLASCSDTVEPGGGMESGSEVMNMSLNLQPLEDAGLAVTRVHVLIQRGTFIREMDLEITENSAVGVFEALVPGTYEIHVTMYEGESLIATGTGEGVVVAGQTTTTTIQMQFTSGSLEVVVEWGPDPVCSVIAAWDFDEGEGLTVLDISGHDHDGQIVGAEWATGVSGSALEFDGVDDYIFMPGGAWLTQPKGTMEAWIKVDPEETGGRIISTETGGWANGLHINWGTQLSSDEYIDGGIYGGIHSTEGGNHYVETYIDNVERGQWHFVAFVWDADENSLLVFVDGESSTVISPHPGIVDTGEPLTIGCWQNQGYGNGHGGWFDGSVDQVKFYDRPLSIEELGAHWQRGIGNRTWHVNADGTGDVPTIQAGIDAASVGDVILLSDGVFSGEGNCGLYVDKDVVIMSEHGPEVTVIDCQSEARGIRFNTGDVSRRAVLMGITITNGGGVDWGGGIYVDHGASPTIKHNIILGNAAALGGGGVIVDNAGTSPLIENNTIVCNTSPEADGPNGGGGMVFHSGCTPQVLRNIIALNLGGGGMHCWNGAAPTLVGNNVWGNIGGDSVCGDVDEGNFSLDPIFVGPDIGDYGLAPASPCQEYNSICGQLVGAVGGAGF